MNYIIRRIVGAGWRTLRFPIATIIRLENYVAGLGESIHVGDIISSWSIKFRNLITMIKNNYREAACGFGPLRNCQIGIFFKSIGIKRSNIAVVIASGRKSLLDNNITTGVTARPEGLNS